MPAQPHPVAQVPGPGAAAAVHNAGGAGAGEKAIDGGAHLKAVRACLWGLPGVTGSAGLAAVRSALGATHAAALISVHKATQRADGRIRWDISLDPNGAAGAIARLRQGMRKRGWYVRQHVPYVARAHAAPAPRPLLSGRALATWNIGTARNKLEELGNVMLSERVAVAALQETLRTASIRELRIRNCNVLERCMDRAVPGARGVALAVRVGIPMHEIGGIEANPNALWARVIGLDGGASCWTVASVYVPQARVRVRRQQVLAHIRETVASLAQRFGDDEPMLIMGDWNMKQLPLQLLLTQRWGSGLFAAPLAGSAGSNAVPGKAPTAIDHIVVNNAAYQRLCGKGTVLRKYNLSTHWPVKVEVTMAAAAAPPAPAGPQVPQLVTRVVRDNRLALALHNKFAVLAESIDDVIENTGTDGAVRAFFEAARGACADLGAVREVRKAGSPAAYNFSAATKRLIAQSRAASGALHVTGKMSRDPIKLAAARAARKAAREAQKADVARSKQRRLAKAVAGLYDGLRPDVFWRFLRDEVVGPRAPASMTQPVRDSAGKLRVIPSEIREVWAQHYRELSKAAGGRRGKQWWAEHHPLPRKTKLPGLDGPITWQEMVQALRATPDGTAPGDDGIPSSVLRAALLRENGTTVNAEDALPQTPLGDVLLRLANEFYDSGVIPPILASATVVNVPKHGADPTEKDSYRGVSLISTLLKLVDRIVAERVYAGLVARRRIRREQAGFRKVEEAMGQVCSLAEVLGRRIRVGKKTYLAFIDLRKAFDCVSHGAMLHRLSSEGVRGKALRFFEAQYENPTLRVRVGGELSESIALEQGVRQGAPSSPVLFDVFIDSILDEMIGILVPGLPAQEKATLLAGLLFADDAVLTMESAEALQAALDKLTAWADKWEMTVGHAKCGVMVVGDPVAHAEAKTRAWMVQGRPIPVVDAYKYLGVMIDYKLTFEPNTELRVAKGRKALYAVRWILMDRDIPLTVKAIVYKSLVHPVLCFGGELVGLSKTDTAALTKLQNCAVKWMAVGTAAANLGVAPLLAELDIPTVRATLAGAKVRAMVKYPSLSTWAGLLSRKRMPIKRLDGTPMLWSDRGKGPATRLVKDWRDLPAKSAGRAIVKSISQHFLKARARTALGAKAYLRYKFAQTRHYLKLAARRISDAPDVAWLTKARTGMCWFGHTAAAAGRIPTQYRRECAACGKKCKDTLSHLIIRCNRYRTFRPLGGDFAGHLMAAKALARKSSDSSSRACDRAALALLLGGSIRREGKRVGLGPAWLGSAGAADSSESLGRSEDPDPNTSVAGDAPNVSAAGAGESVAGGDLPAMPVPVFITVAKVLRGVMEAHLRLLRGIEVPRGAGSCHGNGVPDESAPKESGGGGRRRRRADARERAGQLSYVAQAVESAGSDR